MALPRLVPSLVGLLFVTSAACAHHASDAAPTAAAPAPAKTDRDTAPDKIFSQRQAAGLQQNEDDQRWGIGPAQERKEQEKQKAAAQSSSSSKAINVTGAPTPTPPPSPATTP